MTSPQEPVNLASIWSPTDEHIPQRVDSGIKALDALISGGLPYSSATCISSVNDEDTTHISNSFICSHLHSSNDATVTIIDTTNAFDVRTLSRRVKESSSDPQDDILAILDRVTLVRVFDFAGARDSIDKINTVHDSHHLLIIDRLSHAASMLLKNNAVQGQAQLDAFFRSLMALTRRHVVCTMLVDGFVQARESELDDACSFGSTDNKQPFFNHLTAPALDLHIHIHTRHTNAEARIVEVAADRYGGRAGQWTSCDLDEGR